jgi:hypothetical protein
MVRTLTRAIPVVLALAVVAVGVALGFGRTGDPLRPGAVRVSTGPARASSVAGTWKRAHLSITPTSFEVADAVGGSVALFSAPDVPLDGGRSLTNPTHEGLPVAFLVLEDHGPWLKVRVSQRPNGLVAWVQRREVSLRRVPNHVVIDVSDRKVTVLHGDDVLLEEVVGVGTDRTPTPLGHFFVDGTVRVPNPNGPYGAYQVSVSGFSEVLQSFGGGVGQIAMHGTNRPQLLGQPVSNGCVRMTNDAITRMSLLAPLGTPVEIVA